ncbi:MAG: hypothetical protein LBI40_00735 [Treponema sp.]|jgi:hypothetical protein|nr:hypothetical protein [Treponema sp.]
MKEKLCLVVFIFLSCRLFAIGEQILKIGADAGWSLFEKRNGVTESESQRPWNVLSLAPVKPTPLNADMVIGFDEDNPSNFYDKQSRYAVEVQGRVSQAGALSARMGKGAARFFGGKGVSVKPASPAAQFSPGGYWGDFSIEFWALPFNMGNGEQVLQWSATTRSTNGYLSQRIQCISLKNRFQWTFSGFFTAPGSTTRQEIVLQQEIILAGTSSITPKTWSHHIIRFDSQTGLLEYLVNGQPEAVAYATSTTKEGGEVYPPLIGENGVLVLGEGFIGLMDEFCLYSGFTDATTAKYPGAGGRAETQSIDLGEPNSTVLRVDASAGRMFIRNNTPHSEFVGRNVRRFPDDSELQFFIRTSESPYAWADDWSVFTPGKNLTDIRGRYIQIAVQFYPSGDGEASPYLDELNIAYKPDDPPLPPTMVTAIAKDGAVVLAWKNSPDIDTLGYFVYYGAHTGEYFGEDALQGVSPIDVGNKAGVRIDGLKNGTLYYFAVSAYDQLTPPHLGMFSRETSARPLTGQGE